MLGEEDHPLEKEKLDYLAEKPYELLFVDGNHEGFPSLQQYPEEWRYGAPVRRIRDNIFWLRRGCVYTIEGKTFFTLGGAATPDFDKPNKLAQGKWFPEEIPTREELDRGEEALAATQNRVDYIVTHTAPNRYIYRLIRKNPGCWDEDYVLTSFLEELYRKVRFEKWFFGHFHQDQEYYDGMCACMDAVHEV